MSSIPTELKYAATHEWLQIETDGSCVVGISDHAQAALGDLVFIELPEVGANLVAGDEFAVVESVKAASDIYAPIAGEVIAINDKLVDEPEIVNSDPYGDGWMVKIQPLDSGATDDLLDAAGYAAQVAVES